MSRSIAIVGFSGAGKSVFGHKLAEALGKTFVDLDLAIEERYRTSIPVLFAKYGEPAFRKCERAVLEDVLRGEDLVIATGGGAPCYADSMELMNSCSTTVYLSLPEDVIYRNLRESKKRRPLTDNMDGAQLKAYIHETLLRRAPFYETAHHTVFSADGIFDLGELVGLL